MNFINFWFLKQIFYSIRKLFKHKFLVLIIFGIIIYFLIQSKCFAFSINDLNVSNFSSNDVQQIYSIVEANKENYDSVFVRYLYSATVPNRRITFAFYNSSDLGRLYITPYYDAFNYLVNSEFSLNGSVKYMTYSYPDFTFNAVRYDNTISLGIRDLGTTMYTTSENYFATNRTIYTSNSFSTIWFQASNVGLNSSNPFITNSTFIPSWTFERLLINTDGLTLSLPEGLLGNWEYSLLYKYSGNTYSIPINEYFIIDENTNPRTFYFSIPNNIITNNIVIRENSTIQFILHREKYNAGFNNYNLGTYTLTLSSANAEIINQNNSQQQQSSINVHQQQTAENTQQINESINNSEIDFSNSNLPSDNTEDITQEGINGIFTSIYNAFCNGSAQDIIFPIPFTGKEISLSANYVRQMLSSSNANWVITIIEAFWWYLISRYIISDISKKITKIKSGNIENIQNDNIKEEML